MSIFKKISSIVLLGFGLVIGMGVLKHFYGNQPWMTVVAGTFLAAGIAWVCNKSAGVIVSVAAMACLLIAGVQMYHKWEVKDHPEVVMSERAAAQAAQVQKIISAGGPGAGQKLALLNGTFGMDSVFAGNTTVRMDEEVKNLPAGSITYPNEVYDRMIGLADTIRQNVEKTRQIWNRLEGIPEKPKSVEVKVDITDPDGYTLVVPSGMQANVRVVRAHYALNYKIITQNNAVLFEEPIQCNEIGVVEDNYDPRFLAPGLAHYATIYNENGEWSYLTKKPIPIVNRGGRSKKITITVNDIKESWNNSKTYDGNTGELIISYELTSIPVELASTY